MFCATFAYCSMMRRARYAVDVSHQRCVEGSAVWGGDLFLLNRLWRLGSIVSFRSAYSSTLKI